MTDSTTIHGRLRTASIVDSNPIAAFFGLTLAISWGIWIPLFVLLPSATSVVMIPGAFGPVLAAVAVLRFQGRSIQAWLLESLDYHSPPRWYVVALGLPLGLAVVLGVGLTLTTGRFAADRLPRAAAMYLGMVLVLSVLGGGQEELGWRGFALPALQDRYDALTASIIIGLIWAVWHLPAFVFGIPGYTTSFPLYTLLVVGLSIILTWLYHSTDGSVLLAMLFHGSINAAPSLGMSFVGDLPLRTMSPYVILVPAVWIVALLLVVRYGQSTLSSANASRQNTTKVTRSGD